MSRISLYILLTTFLVLRINGDPTKFVEGNYNIKEVDLLGTQFTSATFTYTFDQPLYIFSPPTCPPSLDCENRYADCFCDYSQTDVCGTNTCADNCTTSYCNMAWDFLPLNGNFLKKDLMAESTASYRFQITNPCQGFRIRVNVNYGEYVVYLKYGEPASTLSHDISKLSRGANVEYFVCPDAENFRLGTWFVAVFALYDTSFNIGVDLQPLPQIDYSTPECTLPAEYQLTHQCVQDSIPIHEECGDEEYHYFYFEYTGCQHIMMTLTRHDYLADSDLYGSYDNPTPNFMMSEFNSYFEGDEYEGITVCPPEGQSKGHIFLTVDCWQPGEVYSNFSLFVTTNATSLWKYTPLTSLGRYEYLSAMVDTAYLDTYEGQLLCDFLDFTCTQFWYNFPATDASIYMPVPPAIRGFLPSGLNQKFQLEEDELPLNNTFSIALLLEYTQGGVTTTVFDRNALPNVTLYFNGAITNKNGEGVFGGFSAQNVDITCDSQKFEEISSEQDILISTIDNITSSDQLNALRYQIDLLKFKDGWNGCTQLLSQLLTSSTFTQLVNSTDCVEVPGTPQYDSDPCCNYLTGWSIACVPREINKTISITDINKDLVSQQCSNADCTDSFLQDYKLVANEATGGCSSSSNSQQQAFQYMQKYRACKTIFDDVTCYSDIECGNYTCDLSSHTCLVPFSVQEYSFVQCVIDSMDSSQIYYLNQYLGVTTNVDRNTLANMTYSLLLLQHTDCVGTTGLNLQVRSYMQYSILDVICTAAYSCPDAICPDKSCPAPDEACYNWCSSEGTTWVSYPSSESSCLETVYCNWNENLCDGLNFQECENMCNQSQSFCGICENGQDCVEFPGISSEECAATTVCVLPNGTFAINLTECNSYNKCSHFCAPQCQSLQFEYGACFSTVETNNSCISKGGSWVTSVCYFPGNAGNCSAYGGVYQNCENLSGSQCLSCQNGNDCPITQSILGCYLNTNIECQTEQDCSNAGYCSDQDLVVNLPTVYGACITNRTLPIGTYQGVSILPFCFPLDTNFPNGCISNYSDTQENCENEGFQWWYPSTTKQECERQEACYDVYLPNMQQEFSPKSREDCAYNDGVYKQIFEWTPAKWYSGVQRQLKWIPRKVNTRYSWRESIDLVQLENIWNGGINQLEAIQLKSDILCNARSTQTLSTISCDCSHSSSTNCFKDSIAIPVTEAIACAGALDTVIQSPIATLEYSNTSISFGCTDILFSQISALRFQAEQQIRLSANFVTYKQPSAFSIRNKNGEPIGTLLGDGSEISHGVPIENAYICLQMRSDLTNNNGKFTVYDFATSDESYSQLIPMNIPAIMQNGQVCAHLPYMETTANYFPIIRADNWENRAYQRFDAESNGLIYTLAVLFLIVSVFAIIKLVFEIVLNLKNHKIYRKIFKLKHNITLFTFLFNFIRAIYFFALPSGANENRIGDYILVVLPTFFFFSAFSTVLVLWAVTVSNKMTNRKRIIRIMKNITIIVNIALYILFIIIVLVFQFSTSPNALQCGGRVASTLSDTKQQQISIAYATIIATLSLAIGVGFVVYGIRLRNTVKSSLNSSKSKSYKKLNTIAIIGATSFLLHCAFILIVTGASGLTIMFTFFGLLITEILPSIFILGAFWKPIYALFFSSDSKSSNNTGSTYSAGSTVEMKKLEE